MSALCGDETIYAGTPDPDKRDFFNIFGTLLQWTSMAGVQSARGVF